MADLDKLKTEPIAQFFDITDDIAAGMLGIAGSGQLMQPMKPHVDRETRSLWFFVKKDADITKAVKAGSRGDFCVIGRDHDYHACVTGVVRAVADKKHIERYWDNVTAAWFNDKDDPNLTMLELRLDNGVAWASTSSSLLFGWEILKANMADREPDVGARKHFSFAP